MKIAAGPWTMLAGYLCFGFMPVFLKLAQQAGWPAGHTVAARFGIGCLLVLLLMRASGSPFRSGNPRALLMRGVYGGAAVLLYFTAIERSGAGMGTLLNYTHSIWANVLGVFFAGQRPKPRFWALLALAMLGLWLVIDPRGSADPLGLGLGLLSGVLGGAAILTIKELRRSDSALTILSSLLFIGLLFSIPAVAWEQQSHPELPWGSQLAWLALLAMALFSFAGQALFTHGFKGTSVQFGTLLSLITPILAVINGHFFFKEPLNGRILTGSALILMACALAGLSEREDSNS